jgi:hypothetical protein
MAEETESRAGTEACILVTILESREREKGSNDSESSSEAEMEVGTETEMAFIGAVFSVKRTGDSVFLWEGWITVFNGITGTDRLCNEGPGQDDKGRGGNTMLRTK